MLVLVIIVAVVIFVVAGSYSKQRVERLMKEGAIASRDYDFYRQEYVYASPIISFGAIVDEVKRQGLGESGSGMKASRENGVMTFASKTPAYGAQLVALEDAGDEHRYRFNFTSWETYKGTPSGAQRMSMLVTAVEKALLTLDPLVTVSTRYQEDIKTRTKLI